MAIRSIDDYLRAVQASFLPEAASGRSAVLQYDFTGREEGVCHAVISAGAITVGRGAHPAPTAIVHADFDLWMRIIAHDVDGLIANQDGYYTVEGDFLTLMDSDVWFTRS